MILLGALVTVLALLTPWLWVRVRDLDARVARLEGRHEVTGPYRAAPPHGDDPEVREALRQGNKIEAIKRYRELTGAGLKEAKEAVEAVEARGV